MAARGLKQSTGLARAGPPSSLGRTKSRAGYDAQPMRALRAAIAVSLLSLSCGSPGQSNGSIDPTGGEVCLSDSRVCISIPPGGVRDVVTLSISPTNEAPIAG